jgi:hypothetical protein
MSKLYNEELRNVYRSPDVMKTIKLSTIRCAGHVTRMVEKRGAYRVLVGKP